MTHLSSSNERVLAKVDLAVVRYRLTKSKIIRLPYHTAKLANMKTVFCSTVNKNTKVTPLGLHLWASPTGDVIIVHIDDHGLFAKKLKVGMQLDSINNMPCQGMSAREIQFCLEELTGRISITTRALELYIPPPAVASLDDEDSSTSSSNDSMEDRSTLSIGEQNLMAALFSNCAF